ncbi:ABC transporter ATP-binding protein [Granulosicoccus antarcticus]|uniref:ABC-type dipeptide transporter n=1 Tax=Granulosicoccus antarcticus IMCC3135 TaxID=1192854 RepID=A0A2Z2NNH6_9GAMM|nr:ABC transporter ATP-binding protein [Granulosicoccus antarcticus]ASJ72783.1 Glutathione import ATP-binding protein GsiA [Granulosicoccus antarcticus IMCC3135]
MNSILSAGELGADVPDTAPEPILQVRDLTIQVATATGGKTVLDGISFTLMPNEVLCLAGESGSGKSLTAMAIMGLLPKPAARITHGQILLNGQDLVDLPESQYRKLRATRVAMIFQEPMTSLNPIMSIGEQISEVLRAHQAISAEQAAAAALELLKDVRMSAPERRLKQYPHELSGGMRQRVVIAIALACRPDILIADEPTTALDVTVQAEILDLISKLQERTGTAVIMITHDMGVVAEIADRVIVMRAGKSVETSPVKQLFAQPSTDYTRTLLAAVPRLGTALNARITNPAASQATVVEVNDLSVRFPVRGGLFNRVQQNVHAVENVSLSINAGETLALVGESGSGKSTIGKALMSLLPFKGEIRINGRATRGLSRQSLRAVRRDVQMIFQDPYASLDPRMPVGDQVAEPLLIHALASGSELTDRVAWLFQRVGLPLDAMRRHPHEFSGGQRQRICIARALALNPKVIVADECVSALDVSVQAQVLELLRELQEEQGLSYLFISHDMAVVEQVSDRVAVLYAGQVVESGPTATVLGNPGHAYTQRLLSAVPIPDPNHQRPPFLRTEEDLVSVLYPEGMVPNRQTLLDRGNNHWVAVAAG